MPDFLSAFFIAFLIVCEFKNFVFPFLLLRTLGATSSASGFFLFQALRTEARLGTIGRTRCLPILGTPKLPWRTWRLR